jgi:two-component system, sensor histidine kinase and response regulator
MNQERPKILIVDDVPANLVVLRKLLAKVPADVISASSGNEALAQALDHEFALVLLDVQMPEMDGYEVAEWMQSEEQTRGTPIIFVTAAFKDDIHRITGYEAGAVDYIEKPIEPTILLSKVGVFLRLYQQKQLVAQALDQLKSLNENLEQRVEDEVHKNLEQERIMVQQSRLAAMGEMIGNIAHQWRQPLNALGLLLANIKDANDFGELDTEQIESSVAKGRQLINKMSTTIDDFRNFFKPNKEKTSFSLKKAVQDTLEILSASLRNHNITVHLDAPEDIIAYGFPNEYFQVMLNILNNSKDAMLGRQLRNGEIHITITRHGENAQVIIRDSGGGIPADILPKVFDPYFTTKEKGTGIGLYMSKLIIENNMGGQLDARNVENGAEFSVICPVGENSSV